MQHLQQRAPAQAPTSVGGGRLALRAVHRLSAGRAPLQCRAAAAPAADTKSGTVADLQANIIKLSGSKYGHDLPEPTRQVIEAKVKELEGLQLPVKADMGLLTGSKWTTVYTTSTGTSSGMVGPFITDVVQDFPAEEPGVYYNVSTLGFISARLRGEYKVTRDDRIDLEFRNITLSIGPFKAAEKVFEQGAMRGYWKLSYCDAGFRVFYTNKGNLFVLRRLDTA